jgi:putative sigma-54 modulation protein
MNIEYVARNCQLDDGLRELADERLKKVRRFLDDPVDVHLTLDIEKHRHIAELLLHHRHGTLQATEEADDLRDAISLAVDKIEKQARRSHKKHHQARRRSGRNDGWSMEVVEAASVGAGSERKIIEASMIQIKPMSIDEAAMQLENGRQEFIVFRDAEIDQISVLYRRRDGNYGLITPET